MAWQHRDLNYHQSGYQDRYGPGADGGRPGPSSNSDRLSHRTDKSWKDQPSMSPYGPSTSQYPPKDYPNARGEYQVIPRAYPHSRDLSPSDQFASGPQRDFQNGRPQESRHSATATSTISSSSSEDDSENIPHMPLPQGTAHPGAYAYGYPGYAPSQAGYAPSVVAGGYPGTMKSAKSVPALLAPTFDGEPCPVHHGPMPPPAMGVPPMSMPPMVHPGYATMGPPRRAASIYDMRMMSPPPTIYGTLPPPGSVAPDSRSVAGSNIMGPSGVPMGIPPQFLPPMARPKPLVIGEGGTPEVLPTRSAKEKSANIPKAILAAKGETNSTTKEDLLKRPFCCKGGTTVGWIILSVIVLGVMLTLMLLFIL